MSRKIPNAGTWMHKNKWHILYTIFKVTGKVPGYSILCIMCDILRPDKYMADNQEYLSNFLMLDAHDDFIRRVGIGTKYCSQVLIIEVALLKSTVIDYEYYNFHFEYLGIEGDKNMICFNRRFTETHCFFCFSKHFILN